MDGKGHALAGSKCNYLLGRTNLKAGLNRPVESQAVRWATVAFDFGQAPGLSAVAFSIIKVKQAGRFDLFKENLV